MILSPPQYPTCRSRNHLLHRCFLPWQLYLLTCVYSALLTTSHHLLHKLLSQNVLHSTHFSSHTGGNPSSTHYTIDLSPFNVQLWAILTSSTQTTEPLYLLLQWSPSFAILPRPRTKRKRTKQKSLPLHHLANLTPAHSTNVPSGALTPFLVPQYFPNLMTHVNNVSASMQCSPSPLTLRGISFGTQISVAYSFITAPSSKSTTVTLHLSLPSSINRKPCVQRALLTIRKITSRIQTLAAVLHTHNNLIFDLKQTYTKTAQKAQPLPTFPLCSPVLSHYPSKPPFLLRSLLVTHF